METELRPLCSGHRSRLGEVAAVVVVVVVEAAGVADVWVLVEAVLLVVSVSEVNNDELPLAFCPIVGVISSKCVSNNCECSCSIFFSNSSCEIWII